MQIGIQFMFNIKIKVIWHKIGRGLRAFIGFPDQSQFGMLNGNYG